MMRQARQRIVVADHRKIGLVGTSLIWPAADIDILVTDKATTDETLAPFADKKIVAMRA
jgi:DeoR/GlpR family transcriptional regulator of sugar metabolism